MRLRFDLDVGERHPGLELRFHPRRALATPGQGFLWIVRVLVLWGNGFPGMAVGAGFGRGLLLEEVLCDQAEWPRQLLSLLAELRTGLIEAALALFGDILLQGVELLGGELSKVDVVRSRIHSGLLSCVSQPSIAERGRGVCNGFLCLVAHFEHTLVQHTFPSGVIPYNKEMADRALRIWS